MSSESLALSDIWGGTPDEAEYDGVYAAVMATERGRWFLTEYASRNRQTDTHAVLGALARLEAAVRRNGAVQTPANAADCAEQTRWPDVAAAAERIQDIAFMLRERAVDPDLCDALDAAVREIAGACDDGGIRLQVDDKAEPANAERTMVDDASFVKARLFATEMPEAAKSSEAIATIEPEIASTPQSEPSRAVIAAVGHEHEQEAAPAEASEKSPRWYIEPPDFAFRRAAREPTMLHTAQASAENGHAHSLLPQAEMLSGPGPGPQDDPAELFESPADALAAASIITPAPAIMTPADFVPPLMRSAPGPAPADPLAGLRALSEEEVIALFS